MSDSTMSAGTAPAAAPAVSQSSAASANTTTFAVILSLSFCHLLNDMMQSLVPALYPILKENYALSFGQVGLITLAFQCTASMLQPLVGLYTDKKPQPYSLKVGGNMGAAAGPLLAAFIVVPHGQHSIVWFSAAALVAMFVLFQVGGWYARRRAEQKPAARKAAATAAAPALSRKRVTLAVAILVALL